MQQLSRRAFLRGLSAAAIVACSGVAGLKVQQNDGLVEGVTVGRESSNTVDNMGLLLDEAWRARLFAGLVEASDPRLAKVDVELYADFACNLGRLRAWVWSEAFQEHLVVVMDVTHEILLSPDAAYYAQPIARQFIRELEWSELERSEVDHNAA
jgi:hypothetical protein